MSSDRMTEVLRYLTAISHDVGGLRAEVKELRKEVGELRTGQDELRTGQDELRAGQDELRAGQNELRIGQDELRKEVRALTTRFDRLESRVLDIRADKAELEDRVTALEGRKP